MPSDPATAYDEDASALGSHGNRSETRRSVPAPITYVPFFLRKGDIGSNSASTGWDVARESAMY
jgi:hypothetical protein